MIIERIVAIIFSSIGIYHLLKDPSDGLWWLWTIVCFFSFLFPSNNNSKSPNFGVEFSDDSDGGD